MCQELGDRDLALALHREFRNEIGHLGQQAQITSLKALHDRHRSDDLRDGHEVEYGISF